MKPPHPELLLHPTIPMPMHGLAPRVLLGKQWWDTQRYAAYKKYDDHCWACGVHKRHAKFHKWLEGHERYKFDYPEGLMLFESVVALCHACHNYIHSGRLAVLLERGAVHPDKAEYILKHGERILDEYSLVKPPAPGLVASWASWRLVIEGKEFRSKFRSIEEHRAHYSRYKDSE